MLKKAKLYSLLAIIVASTIIGLFGLAQSAKAQESPDAMDATLLAEAQNVTYQRLMHQCLEKYNGNTPLSITVKDFSEGNLIASPYNTVSTDSDDKGWLAGYIVDPVDGKLSCDGADGDKIIANYKKATGYSTPSKYQQGNLATFHFLCVLGFRPQDENYQFLNSTIDGQGDDIDECVMAAANGEEQSYGLYANNANNPEFTPAMQYAAYRYTMLTVCGAAPATDPTQQENRRGVIMVKMDGSGLDPQDYLFPTNKDVSVFQGKKVNCRDSSDGREGLPEVMNAVAAAYATYRTDPANAGNEGTTVDDAPSNGENTGSTCRIDSIGWIVCPVLNFLALIADNAYEYMDGNLLRAQAIDLEDTESNGLLRSWKVMRDLANVAFVIAFMIVVFSQITSIGLSNYGLKKLLPKLIVCAVLVNLSFYVCALLIDVSNILGSSLKSTLESLVPRLESGETSFWQGGNTTRSWIIIIGAILAGARIDASFQQLGGATASQAYGEQVSGVLLSIAIPLLLVVTTVVAVVVVALIIRQALIILLVVVSPLAFVALLLPNTEEYFTRWRKLFTTMLMFYPIVAVVFGASKLASTIISNSDPDDTGTQLAGAAAAVIPLFIMPTLIKLSGGVLNRFTGLVNDPTKGPIDSLRRKASASREQQKAVRGGRAIATVGQFVESGAMGGRSSRAKRLLTRPTAYGRNQSKLRDKDELSAIESSNQNVYLNSQEGQAARNAAKTAQGNLHHAEVRAETVHLESPEGIHLELESKELEARKQLAATRAQTQAIEGLTRNSPGLLGEVKDAENLNQIAENQSKVVGLANATMDTKIQAATSTQNLSNAEGRDRQAYEELAAAGDSNGTLLTKHRVSDTTAAAVQNANFQAKATESATGTARSQGESNYAQAVSSDPDLLRQAGGNVNTVRGESRARARAATTVNKDEAEAVDNETQTMSRMAIDSSRVGNPGDPDLESIMMDTRQSVERRAAAAVMRIRRGTDKDIIKTVDYMGSAPLDDDMKTIQQYVFPEINKRPQIAIGASAMAQGNAGEFHPPVAPGARVTPRPDGTTIDTPMDALARSRLTGGKLNPIGLAKSPADQVDHILDVIENGVDNASVMGHANFVQLQRDLTNYLNTVDSRPESERPTAEMLAKLVRIRDAGGRASLPPSPPPSDPTMRTNTI